ncbi:MAG: redoxin domain-containing protein [Candidatus Korobacteraceae bacterium]
MLGVGEKFPHFSLIANVSAEQHRAFRVITDQSFGGQWKVYFFWPQDFTPLSLAEIVDFGTLESEFRERHTQLLGCSVESEVAHLAWRTQEDDLRELALPMLSDLKRELCGELGILDENEGVAQRATFIVDPHRVIRFVYVTELNISRDPGEVLRVLADLQEWLPS